jgi:hypothetical protein
VCGSWGTGGHLGNQGARPSRKGKGAAVGSRQRRRRDLVTWPPGQKMDSPQLQETVMHRVSVIVHCTAIVYCSIIITGTVSHCIIVSGK